MALIVNADDLGLCDGVTRGILEAHRSGIVTSTSLLVTTPGFQAAAEAAKQEPRLGVGLHLDLTVGRALGPAARLTDPSGRFRLTPAGIGWSLLRGRVAVEAIREEWDRQLRAFQSTGLMPTHVDSEKHVHMLPMLFPIALDVAQRAGARAIRVTADPEVWRRPAVYDHGWRGGALLSVLARKARTWAQADGLKVADACHGIVRGRGMEPEWLAQVLHESDPGVHELVCHPGYEDSALHKFPSLRYPAGERLNQLKLLSNPDLRHTIERAGVCLTHFGRVPC
jgi:chitin disaccharide deacetylase